MSTGTSVKKRNVAQHFVERTSELRRSCCDHDVLGFLVPFPNGSWTSNKDRQKQTLREWKEQIGVVIDDLDAGATTTVDVEQKAVELQLKYKVTKLPDKE